MADKTESTCGQDSQSGQQQQSSPKMSRSEKSAPAVVETGAWQQEQEFLDYMFVNLHGWSPSDKDGTKTDKDPEEKDRKVVESRRRSAFRSHPAPAPALSSGRVGLEHLDNLCKLMEQLSELRDQNVRLRKRVQYLEDMKTLQEMHQELQYQDSSAVPKGSADSLDVDAGRQKTYDESHSVESLLDEPAPKPDTGEHLKKMKTKSAAHARFKKQLLAKNRERSKSVGYDENNTPSGDTDTPTAETGPAKTNPADLAQVTSVRPKTKVSKWTRVKEAFRWEKAHHVETSQGGSKASGKHGAASQHPPQPPQQQQQLLSDQQLKEASGSREMRPRKASDNETNDACHVPGSPNAQITSRRASSASSSSSSECLLESEILKSFADARELPFYPIQHHPLDSATEEGDDVFTAPRRRTSNQSLGGGANIKSRSGSKRLHRHSTVSCEGTLGLLTSSPASTPETPAGLHDPADTRQRPCLTISVPSEEIAEETEPPEVDSGEASERNKWSRLKQALLSTQAVDINRQARSVPSSPSRLETFNFDENVIKELQTIEDEDSSTGSQKAPSTCTGDQPILKSPIQKSPTADDFKFSSEKKLSDTGEDPKKSPKVSPVHTGNLMENISPEFRKKVEEWERIKSGNSDPCNQDRIKKSSDVVKQTTDLPPEFKKKLAEWEIRKAVAGKSDQNVEELQKILPEEFNRKLQEWERIKAAGKPVSPGLERQGSASAKHRKNKGAKQRDDKSVKVKSDVGQREKQKEKELQWLEKELQKIEREKHRLEREREKYIERETRLEKIREAMRQPQADREICIRTSTGEFRFQGLSRKFTKKLWQWEEQKNIRPEASTIALLDPANNTPEPGEISARPGNGLTMSRSKSESSIADLVSPSVHSQPSSMSLNDAEAVDFDRRLAAANSAAAETDQQSLRIHGAVLVEVEDVIDENSAIIDIPEFRAEEAVCSYAPPEVTQLIDAPESGEEDECLAEGRSFEPTVRRNDSVRSECSFKLLEENLSIIDRLRAKEAIFRDLELQMNNLDGHITGVTSSQLQEMDRLREQEAFLQTQNAEEEGAEATEQPTCVEILKQRIEQLEQRGLKLKAEKEQLQAEFAKHSQQQSLLAQKLVDKMSELRQASKTPVTSESVEPDVIHKLRMMTNELLEQARVLEESLQNRRQQSPGFDPTGNQEEEEYFREIAQSASQEINDKALQLKKEFARLKSQEEQDSASKEVEEETPEMTEAAMSKIFVETRRLIFTPAMTTSAEESEEAFPNQNDDPGRLDIVQPIETVPWRRPRLQRQDSLECPEGSVPWRKKTEESAKVEWKPPVRSTAPNIRRMIAKYHEKIAGTDSRKNSTGPILSIPRTRLTVTEPQTPPDRSPKPEDLRNPDSGSATPTQMDADLLQPMQLAKSHSAGMITTPPEEPQQHAVLRSGSGHTLLSSAAKCARNPSFFRKSPLDPSIDDLLQRYQGKKYIPPAPELPRSPLSHERAAKLRKAKEQFLAAALEESTSEAYGTEDSIAPEMMAASTSQRDSLGSNGTQRPVNIGPSETADSSERRAVQTLCRQSLFMELGTDSSDLRSMDSNTPEAVESIRSCPSSPSLSHSSKNRSGSSSRNSWLKQPKLLFFRPK